MILFWSSNNLAANSQRAGGGGVVRAHLGYEALCSHELLWLLIFTLKDACFADEASNLNRMAVSPFRQGDPASQADRAGGVTLLTSSALCRAPRRFLQRSWFAFLIANSSSARFVRSRQSTNSALLSVSPF